MFQQLSELLTSKEKLICLGLLLMMLLSAAMEIVGIGLVMPIIALLSKPELIDQNKYLSIAKSFVQPSSNDSFLLILCVLIILILIGKNAFLALQNYVQARFIFAKGARLAARLFDNYIHAPYTFHLARNSGQLMGSLALASSACSSVLVPLMTLLTESIVVAIILAMLLILSPSVTLGLAASIAAISVLIYYPFRNWNNHIGQVHTNETIEISKIELQGLKAVKDSKIRNVEDYFCADYLTHLKKKARASAEIAFMGNLPRFLIEALIVTLGIGTIAILVISDMPIGSITLTLSLFAVSMIRIMPSMSRIQYSLATIRHHQSVFQPLAKELTLFEREDKTPRRPNLPFHKMISIDAISFRYSDIAPDIFDKFTLDIPKNTSVAFVGSTGCGKTTLVDIILGLLKPSEGVIRADGVDIRENLPAWQKRIGYVPQFIFLLDDTIKANVAFGLPTEEIDGQRVRECLQTAQILEFIDALPKKTDNLIGENGIRLSGGQRQRIGIARALYHNPEILVLDEATSALDNDTEKAFIDALKILHGKLTIIMVAHRLTTVQNCDRIIKIPA